MTESKRFVHPGLVLSAVLHAGLLLALLFAGASVVRPVPPEPITVEIVPSDEAPQPKTEHVEGTPLDSTSRGSEASSDSEHGSASAEPPRPKFSEPSPQQQAQAQSHPQQGGSPPAAQQAAPPPGEGETPPLPSEALAPPAPAAQRQAQSDAPDQSKASDMFAMPLALPGGRIGGGLDAPASNPAMAPHDDTAAFRARLGQCSRSEALYSMDGRTAILLRVSFKRDGTLAAPPELLKSPLSADSVALTKMALSALERCQPFTELPADKYREWKTLDLVVTPLTLSGP